MKSKIILGILVSLTIILTVFVGVNAVEIEKNLQETKEDLIYSDKYLVNGTNIYRIEPKTSIKEFNKNIELAEGKEVKIYKEKKEITSGYIGTGMTVKGTDGKEYTTIVIGDITGDGLVNQLELTRLIRHTIKLKGWELEGIEKVAADITGDGEVNLVDISNLINYIVYGKLKYEDIKNQIPNLTAENISMSYTPTNWTKESVKVSLKTTITGYTLQYSKDNSTWQDYTKEIEMKENGKIYARLRDNKGMVGNVVSGSISNIDKTAPTVELSPNGGSIVMPEQGNAKISVVLTAKDEGESGLNLLQYAWSQSNIQEPTKWTDFINGSRIEKADITGAGIWYLWTKVIDKAGNRAENVKVSKAFVINENANTITLLANKAGWTNEDVTVIVKYGENLTQGKTLTCSGTLGADYTINGVESVVVKTNGKVITATAKNAEGKIITKALTVNNIDKEKPIINTQLSASSKTTSSIDLSIGVTDSGSGISKIEWYYKLNTESTYTSITDKYAEVNGANKGTTVATTKTRTISNLKTGTYNIYAVVYDVAGNSTISTVNATINMTAKLPTYDQAPKDSNGLLTVNATYSSDEKTAIVPKGFKIVEGIEGSKSIINGLVVQDKEGNEFVWIPVEIKASDTTTSIASFYRSNWSNNARATGLSTNYTEPYANGYEGEAEEYAEMVKSVYENGGFYIGRYEAGSVTERTKTSNGTTEMVVKKNQYPYNYVGWGLTMSDYKSDVIDLNGRNQGKGAVYLSKNMYEGKDVGVTSSLCYGIEWDAMLDFIKDNSHNVINSTRWGNYELTSGSVRLKNTGSSNSYSAKNIYDVAGNVWERTMEASSSNIRVRRGGCYKNNGYDYPASHRSYGNTNFCSDSTGFRIALYIK